MEATKNRHSKGLYHCETVQNLNLEASLRLREQLLCDDAAAVGAFSAQSAAEHSMRVMRHFYKAAMNIKHPIHRRVQDLGAELLPQADALFCSALANCRLAQGNSVSQHDIDVFSNKVNKGLQAIVDELQSPLHLHGKPDEVVTALWGGIEEALYRGYLASPLWNYYRCSLSKEDAIIKQLLAKLQSLSPADISRAGVDCSSTEWNRNMVLPSDTAKAKTNLAAAIETAKSIQQWLAPVARLLVLQSCSSDVARALGLQMEEKSAVITSAVTLPSLVFVLIQASVSDIASTNVLLSDMLSEGMLAQELGYSAATWDSVTVFLLEQASPSSAGSRPVSGAYEVAAALQLPEPDAVRRSGGDNGAGEDKLEGGGQGSGRDDSSRKDGAAPARKKASVRRSPHDSRRPQNETPKFALDANRNMTPLEWEKERCIVSKCRDAHISMLSCLHACKRAYIHASCVFSVCFECLRLMCMVFLCQHWKAVDLILEPLSKTGES